MYDNLYINGFLDHATDYVKNSTKINSVSNTEELTII